MKIVNIVNQPQTAKQENIVVSREVDGNKKHENKDKMTDKMPL